MLSEGIHLTFSLYLGELGPCLRGRKGAGPCFSLKRSPRQGGTGRSSPRGEESRSFTYVGEKKGQAEEKSFGHTPEKPGAGGRDLSILEVSQTHSDRWRGGALEEERDLSTKGARSSYREEEPNDEEL